MQERPLVCIITPTYNRADYLPEAIESVLDQDYHQVEHIIIDDGSTDNTRDVVKSYFGSGKIRYFYQNNCGQNIARNNGVKKARGEFICFLDSDDRFLPKKLSRSLAAFENHPEVDVVYGDYVFIDKNGNELNEKNMPRYSGFITKQLLKDNCVSMNTTMVRTDAIRNVGGFSSHVKVADDYDLWLRMSVNSQFFYVPEKLSAYRLMENQISSDKKSRISSNEEIILGFLNTNPTILTARERRDFLNYFYTRAARFFSTAKEYIHAKMYFKKALREKTLSKRTIRALVRHAINVSRNIWV